MSHSNVNRVVLVGWLTADPELKALPSGRAVCEMRIVCKGVRKGEDGDYVEKPNFFSVRVYGPQAESVNRYMSRGRRVAVDGRLDWREWESEDGRKRQTVEIVADGVEFLDGGNPADRAHRDGEGDGDDDGRAGDERELVGVGAGIEGELEF